MTGDRSVRGTGGPFRFDCRRQLGTAISALLFTIGAGAAFADPPLPTRDWTRTEVREDCANYNALRTPYFGDTHVHTKFSADAVLARTRNDPRDAYMFAQGGTIGLPPYDAFDQPGRFATLDRPLDFTAVTDHAEGFGEARICLDPSLGLPGYDDSLCQSLRATFLNEYHPTNPLPFAFIQFFLALQQRNPMRMSGICGAGDADCAAQAAVVWQATQDAAEEFYDRTAACSFTTFVAYEWSGNTAGNNLHRNVIFRNSNAPSLPISYYEQWKAEGLWAELKSQCLDSGTNCDVLAIPHNSNIANDAMFSATLTDGDPLTAQQAATRASFEPIMELTQVKGDSECRDGVAGTSDEECRFEKLSRTQLTSASNWDQPFSPFAYARGALKRGLSIERQIGVNPFALGFVGATDTHNGTPGAVSEVDYGGIGFSGVADSEPAFILAEGTPPSKIQSNPGGLSVVWAEENSRDALFAAMRRRETYSTSGTRIKVRAFAGRYPLDLCNDPNFVAEGYANGVPMGGDIGPVRGKYSPRFAIQAFKDDGGLQTPLQRIQVVKGWINDKTGRTFEKVFDVAGNANNGAGVDLSTCSETGAANGFDSLCTVWEDPDFKPDQNAFYYVRVLEDPVCRWSQRLCIKLRTCSTLLKSCSKDPTRTCGTDAECDAVNSGSTCTVDYPAVCTSDADCEHLGAGTCGAALAVDCSSPASLPPAAVECCDARIAPTIQERAVASPIFYHPSRMGIGKASVTFGGVTGRDRLNLRLFIAKAPSDFDPSQNDLTLTLSNGSTLWTATIPKGALVAHRSGTLYLYKDLAGTIAGITRLRVTIAKGSTKITVKTGNTDLSTITRADQTLSLDLALGSYRSTATNAWSYAAPKLSVAF
jgi:hypothetical protein